MVAIWLHVQTLNLTNLVIYQTSDRRSLALVFDLCCLIKDNPLVQNSTPFVNSGKNKDSHEYCIVSPYLIVALDSIYKSFICHNLGFSVEKGLETIFDCLELLLTYLQNMEKEKISQEKFCMRKKPTNSSAISYQGANDVHVCSPLGTAAIDEESAMHGYTHTHTHSSAWQVHLSIVST